MAAVIVIWACFALSIVTAQPVTLMATADRKFYTELADHEITIEARIDVAPTTPPPAPAVRNVAFVLDRSGSMAGEPMAALRRATADAVGGLQAGDIVSIVLFGSEVETVVESQRRDQISDLAARLAQNEPVGGAALYDALNQGAALVRRQATAATLNQLILVTDGPPTKGPREGEDFARLAEAFGREGVRLSTIGLGGEFNEDTLAAMARAAYGDFHYAATAADLAGALQAEVASRPAIVGRDAVLSIEFKRFAGKLRSHDWRAPAVENTTLAWSFPQLLDRPLAVLVSAELGSFYARLEQEDFAVVRLRWKGVADGEPHELTRSISPRFSRDVLELRDALEPVVARSWAVSVAREGLQRAIEQLDRGDPRRAWRTLRTARADVRELNFVLEDPPIAETYRQLDAFLVEGERSGSPGLNRKTLRSGLGGQFDPPAPVVEKN